MGIIYCEFLNNDNFIQVIQLKEHSFEELGICQKPKLHAV